MSLWFDMSGVAGFDGTVNGEAEAMIRLLDAIGVPSITAQNVGRVVLRALAFEEVVGPIAYGPGGVPVRVDAALVGRYIGLRTNAARLEPGQWRKRLAAIAADR